MPPQQVVTQEPDRLQVDGGHDARSIEDEASKRALRLGTAEMTKFVVGAVGQRRTAVSLNLRDARFIREWVEGGEIEEDAARARLRLLYRVTYAVSNTYGDAVAAAFLESTNPLLGNRSPLAVLATADPVEQGDSAVIIACRELLNA